MKIRLSFQLLQGGDHAACICASPMADKIVPSRCSGTVGQEKQVLRQFRESSYQGTFSRHELSSHCD